MATGGVANSWNVQNNKFNYATGRYFLYINLGPDKAQDNTCGGNFQAKRNNSSSPNFVRALKATRS